MIANNRILAFVFVLLALPACFAISAALPPLQPPDEIVHYAYARSISLGRILPERKQGEALAEMNPSDGQFLAAFQSITMDLSARVTADSIVSYPDDRQSYAEINIAPAAIYAPVAYFASAFAMSVVDKFQGGPSERLYVGRAANSLLYVTFGSLAILYNPALATLLLAILLLPMSLHQAASLSPDAFSFPATALAVTLYLRAFVKVPSPTLSNLIIPTMLVLFASLTRTPIVFVAILPIVQAFVYKNKFAAISAIVIIIGTAVWLIGFATFTEYAGRKLNNVSSSGQISLLLNNPSRIMSVAMSTLWSHGFSIIRGVVGIYGSYNLPAPNWIFWSNILVLSYGAALGLFSDFTCRMSVRVALSAAAIFLTAATFGAIYLTWSPVGSETVEGVQGRYLIPALLCVSFAASGLFKRRLAGGLFSLFVCFVPVVHAVSISNLLYSLIFRYWL